MSDDTLHDIWRECVATGYGWRRGMVSTDGIQCVEDGVEHSGPTFWEHASAGYCGLGTMYGDGTVRLDIAGATNVRPVPDFTDAATLGALLGMVREAWGTTAHIVRLDTNADDGKGGLEPACWWALATGLASRPLMLESPHPHFVAGPTEAEALLRALIAAPKTEDR